MAEQGGRKHVLKGGSGSGSGSGSGDGSSRVLRLVCVVIASIIVLIGVVVLIIWVSVQPHKPKYHLTYVSSSLFQVSDDGLVSAKFDFNLTTRNSNKKISIYYDKISTAISYDGDYLAWGTLLPFYQGHKNTTVVHTNVIGDMVPLQSHKSHDLKLEHASGSAELVFELYASVRFKVGSWKSGHYTLKVKCRPDPATLHLLHPSLHHTKCKVKV